MGIALGEARALDAPVGAAPSTFARIARKFDPSVIAQPEPNQPALSRVFAEAALFETGRPLLIVPYIQAAPLKLDRIMLCWDGSRSAARAVGDAVPFLLQSKATEIVMVSGEPAKSNELPGADIGHHLARHGIKAEVKVIASPEIDVADTILSVREFACDGRLRPFGDARIHVGWRNAGDPRLHDLSNADVALTRGRHLTGPPASVVRKSRSE